MQRAAGFSTQQKAVLIQALMRQLVAELATPVVTKPAYVALSTDQLTYEILGHAMAVHRAKGSGYRENTYQNDLETHLAQSNLRFAAQKLFDVFDSVDGHRLIGYYIPDFLIEERVIVEIKALPGLDDSHLAQVIGYLAVSGCEVGLLINFGQRSLEWKRILPPKRVQEHKVNRQWLFVPEWLQEG
ncbi:MAG: GxxExxY protein [Caldilineaceae bacterium]|nr:GxxExxY protein [Caldilineaceae bacterium]